VLAGVATHFVHGGQVYAVGLRNIEDVGITESKQYSLILLGNVLTGFGVPLPAHAEASKDITKQNERVLLGFRNTYVFDVSQTDGVDLPEMREVSGDPGENLERLAEIVRGRGITLG